MHSTTAERIREERPITARGAPARGTAEIPSTLGPAGFQLAGAVAPTGRNSQFTAPWAGNVFAAHRSEGPGDGDAHQRDQPRSSEAEVTWRP